MNNWGYVRKNIKINAKMSLQQNLILCLKVTVTALLAELLIYWLAGSLSVPVIPSPDQIKPIHSMLAIFTVNPAVTLIMSLILELSAIFLTAPLNVGMAGLYLNVVRKQGQDVDSLKYRDIFDWYLKINKSMKAFFLMLFVRVLSMLWFLLFCTIPFVAAYYYENTTQVTDIMKLPASYASILLLLLLLSLAGMVFALVRSFAYIPAPYLMAQDPNLSIWGAVAKSGKLMRGHLWEYLMLELSFIPWYLLTILTFWLSLLYFLPYRNACQAIFIRKRLFENLAETNKADADSDTPA